MTSQPILRTNLYIKSLLEHSKFLHKYASLSFSCFVCRLETNYLNIASLRGSIVRIVKWIAVEVPSSPLLSCTSTPLLVFTLLHFYAPFSPSPSCTSMPLFHLHSHAFLHPFWPKPSCMYAPLKTNSISFVPFCIQAFLNYYQYPLSLAPHCLALTPRCASNFRKCIMPKLWKQCSLTHAIRFRNKRTLHNYWIRFLNKSRIPNILDSSLTDTNKTFSSF